MRRFIVIAIGISLLLPLGSGVGRATPATPARVPSFGHVFVIVGENTGIGQVTAGVAPYLVGHLRPRAAWLTHYSALHDGSLSDYVGMLAGRFKRCDAIDRMPANCHHRWNNLLHQLDVRGVGWTGWMESMTNPCDFFDSGTDWAKNIYAAHHDPMVYFTGIEGGVYAEDHRPKGECLRRVLPMGSTAPNDTSTFDAALASGHVSRFDFIVPNECEDGHDPCGGNRITQFDGFLRREIPKIEASPAFGPRSLIVVTFDEGSDASPTGPVVFAALGPLVRPGTYATPGLTHYSFLRTMEQGFGIRRYLHNAATARSIAGIWR